MFTKQKRIEKIAILIGNIEVWKAVIDYGEKRAIPQQSTTQLRYNSPVRLIVDRIK